MLHYHCFAVVPYNPFLLCIGIFQYTFNRHNSSRRRKNQPSTSMRKRAYNVDAVSEMLDLPTSSLYGMIRNKQFPAVKIGKHWRVLKKQLDEHIEKLEDEALW